MSLRFRNRFKILPGIYLNLGKNGVSTTIGPRGANINIGKNGVYLNTRIPGTGISNREKLFSGDTNKPDLNRNLPNEIDSLQPFDKDNNADSTQEIITSEGLKGLKEELEEAKKQREVLASEIKETENKLSELQTNFSKKQNGFFSLFTKKETIETLQNEISETTEDLDDLKKQYEESKADINIKFDFELEEQYKKLSFSFAELINSKVIWDITKATVNTELKSSAKTVVERVEVKFKCDSIDFIKCDHSAFHLQNASGSNLFIYPAFVLLIDKQGEITLIDLKELHFFFYEQKFHEQKETIPSDSKIVDYTWYKSNKDGSRDLRFIHNFQIPVVDYGVFNFSSSNGLNETYYISNIEIAKKFAHEFEQYQDLLNGRSSQPKSLQIFFKEYYNLLVDFSPKIYEIRKKLETDKKLEDKIKDAVNGMTVAEFIQFCILYDFYQILKIISGRTVNPESSEAFGLLLISGQIMERLSATALDMNYEKLLVIFLKGMHKEAVQSIIKLADVARPLTIKAGDKDVYKTTTSNLQSNLCLPTALRLLNHPMFDAYATALYQFANIIAKSDITVSKEEETILKEVYQFTHNPLPEEKIKSLNISEVGEKESLEKSS
jgi:predicted  nucleic acid-binding Zn-ribbon protein